MKIWGLIFVIGMSLPALAAPLNEELSSSNTASLLDSLTHTRETLNQVTLLKQGLESWPQRKKLVQEAQDFIFISTPFWYYDDTGKEFISWLQDKRKTNPQLDLRVIQDWISPIHNPGGSTVKDELLKLTGDGHYDLWNNPLWQRNFSYDLVKNHVHDKMLIVDGKKMITGGMNITDADAKGGTDALADYDMDLLIEGPVVEQATQTFLKIDQLDHYLRSDASFPPFEKEEIEAFTSYFFDNVDDHDFTTVTSDPSPKPPFTDLHKVHIPIKELLADSRYFPTAQSGSIPVRFLYDNPLIDRDPTSKVHTSVYFSALKTVIEKAKSSLWISTPYLTPDREQMALWQQAAKRLDVRIVTNSKAATDEKEDYYRDQLSHYLTYLKSGIKVYEWKGMADMQRLATGECKVNYWPGKMLHAKMVLADGAAVFIGSNNNNHRSKELNNEIMVMVNDETFSQQIVPIFENMFAGFPQNVSCASGTTTVNVVEEMTEDKVRALMTELKVTKEVWDYPKMGS